MSELRALPPRPSLAEIRQVMLSDGADARQQHIEHSPQFVEDLAFSLHELMLVYRDIDEQVGGDLRRAFVVAFYYTGLNSLFVSSQLLLAAHLAPSGNVMRQFGEATALALLCLRSETEVFERLQRDPGRFPAHDALRLVAKKRNLRLLQIDRDWWTRFQAITEQYDHFSHASMLTVVTQFMQERPAYLALGGQFDPGKLQQYQNELRRRISAARVLAEVGREIGRTWLAEIGARTNAG